MTKKSRIECLRLQYIIPPYTHSTPQHKLLSFVFWFRSHLCAFFALLLLACLGMNARMNNTWT